MNATDADAANVIYHQTSPDGQIQALVEQDDRVAYFYLASDLPKFPTKACWVRNLISGPITLDRREMEQGLAPALPRTVCAAPEGAPPLVADQLSVIWFEEGNGAALLEGDEVLAVIPPWSGQEGFHGYARDCTAENSVCWPLPDSPELQAKLQRAQDWWNEWANGNPWKQRQEALLERLEAGLGSPRTLLFHRRTKVASQGLGRFSPTRLAGIADRGRFTPPPTECRALYRTSQTDCSI